jgi:hypothetical protein
MDSSGGAPERRTFSNPIACLEGVVPVPCLLLLVSLRRCSDRKQRQRRNQPPLPPPLSEQIIAALKRISGSLHLSCAMNLHHLLC